MLSVALELVVVELPVEELVETEPESELVVLLEVEVLEELEAAVVQEVHLVVLARW